jgi:ribosomal protein L12E/L44/L45/RPP1/RPP2
MSDAQDLELRHDLLRAVDRAIGAEAEAARLSDQVAVLSERLRESDAALRAARKDLAAAGAERDRLARRIAAMQASTTWRIGRSLVTPASRIARRVRR